VPAPQRAAQRAGQPINATDPSGFISVSSGITGISVAAGHLGAAGLAMGGFGIGTGAAGAGLGVGGFSIATTLNMGLLSSQPAYSGALLNAAQVAPTSGPPTQAGAANAASANKGGISTGVPAGEMLGQDPHAPATCGGSGEPSCGHRRYGSSPMDQMVEQFLRAQSAAPEYPGTVADTILEPAAPEHVASIVQTANGRFRLGTSRCRGCSST
jgi:hypothetical protein